MLTLKQCDPLKLLRLVDDLEGEIWFETPQGDSLELHSTFCQYVFTAMFEDGIAPKGYLRFKNSESEERVENFFEENPED